MSNLEFHKDSFNFEVEGVSMRMLSEDEAKQFEGKEPIRVDLYKYDPELKGWIPDIDPKQIIENKHPAITSELNLLDVIKDYKPNLYMCSECPADVKKLAQIKLGDTIIHDGVKYIASQVDKYQVIFVRED